MAAAPATHLGEQDGVQGFWLRLAQPGIHGHLGNEQVEVSLCVCL